MRCVEGLCWGVGIAVGTLLRGGLYRERGCGPGGVGLRASSLVTCRILR